MTSAPALMAVGALSLVASLGLAQPPNEAADPNIKKEQPTRREQALREEEQLREAEPAINERSTKIGEELKALDRAALKEGDWAKEWAGTYYTGDGLGMNVVIKVAPKSGLSYAWHGCLGFYGGNHGDIVESYPDGLKVKLALPVASGMFGFVSERIYFVRWGDRRYLVPEAQMSKLVNNYNEGGYAKSEMFGIPLWVEGDQFHRRTAEPAGKPQLPPQYDKLLMAKPWRLTITKVTDKPERHVTGDVQMLESEVELEGGADQNVYVGMEISLIVDMSAGRITINRVEEKRCWGTLMMFGNAGMKSPPTGTVLAAGSMNAVGRARELLGDAKEKK